MTWIVYSLTAAVLWGLCYAIYGELVKHLSVPFVLTILSTAVGIFFLFTAFMQKNIVVDIQILKANSNLLKYILIMIAASVGANFCLFSSMYLKSATAAGILEISYPIFTALFAWLLFKETQLSFGLIVGGLLITSGILCVMY